VASRRNEYKRNANFNQISPRSFYHNISHGFDYDDNEFRTNQLQHPFNGSTYYNSARANGIGFLDVVRLRHRRGLRLGVLRGNASMSFNDMISTGSAGSRSGK
jgi:hypothetical protein